MSTLLLIPIIAIAVYSLYRHIKKQTADGGSGTCCDCPSRGKCGSKTPIKEPHRRENLEHL